MTDLIPNLTDLLAELPSALPTGTDAAELARAVSSATSWPDADDALDAVIGRWAAP